MNFALLYADSISTVLLFLLCYGYLGHKTIIILVDATPIEECKLIALN